MTTILVADDVKTERTHVTEILKRNGYSVIEAIDGKEACRKAEEHLPSLVVMDIVMPERDGFGATKKIKANPATEHIKVVVVSSKGQDSDKKRASMVGADGYLIKPVSEAVLIAKVKELLRHG